MALSNPNSLLYYGHRTLFIYYWTKYDNSSLQYSLICNHSLSYFVFLGKVHRFYQAYWQESDTLFLLAN
ncbi:hypothetical protein [Candidatus Harpocratesius sp.]